MQDGLHSHLTVTASMPEDCVRSDTAKQEGPPPKLLQADGRVAVPAGTCTFSEYYRYHAICCACHSLCT
jgi:hypothetical protein